MRAAVEKVTPELAREFLKKMRQNRRVSTRYVSYLARQAAQGAWMLMHQGVAIDEEGHVIDGQHRLLAVLEANTTVPMLVVRGVPRRTMLLIDSHRPRTDVDSLNIAGVDVTPYRFQILRGMLRGGRLALPRVSRDELATALIVLKDAIDFIEQRVAVSDPSARMPVLGAAGRAFFHVSHARLGVFLDVLTGNARAAREAREAHSPPITLRTFIATQVRGRPGPVPKLLYYATEDAIAAFSAGEKRDVVSFPAEARYNLPEMALVTEEPPANKPKKRRQRQIELPNTKKARKRK